MSLSKEQIDTAVEWWGEAFRHPTFDNLGHGASRDAELRADPAAEFPALMAMAHHDRVTAEQVERFRANLRQTLASAGDLHVWLSVDYGPCAELSAALTAADASVGIMSLPWKTSMRFTNGGVQVAKGYGSPFVELLRDAPTVSHQTED